MRRLSIIPILCLLLCQSTMLADYVHTWTTTDKNGVCCEWKTVQKDGYGCMNFRRLCGTTQWTNDGCSWDTYCNGRVIPVTATADPFVTGTNGGILATVSPGTGGSFTPVGSPITCSGYIVYPGWEFHPDGSNYMRMPFEMVPVQ